MSPTKKEKEKKKTIKEDEEEADKWKVRIPKRIHHSHKPNQHVCTQNRQFLYPYLHLVIIGGRLG